MCLSKLFRIPMLWTLNVPSLECFLQSCASRHKALEHGNEKENLLLLFWTKLTILWQLPIFFWEKKETYHRWTIFVGINFTRNNKSAEFLYVCWNEKNVRFEEKINTLISRVNLIYLLLFFSISSPSRNSIVILPINLPSSLDYAQLCDKEKKDFWIKTCILIKENRSI